MHCEGLLGVRTFRMVEFREVERLSVAHTGRGTYWATLLTVTCESGNVCEESGSFLD